MLKGFEKSLVKTIRAARPNLKQSSIQTYVANLKRLGNMLNLTKYKDLGFLKDTDRVMAALKEYSDNTKRSTACKRWCHRYGRSTVDRGGRLAAHAG